MSLKDVVRALTPPILWQAGRAFRSNGRLYQSWEEAVAAAGSYADAPLNEFRAARAAANPGGAGAQLEASALAWLVRLFPGPLTIVDFGGSTGDLGMALRRVRADIDYVVVENPTLVTLLAARSDIRFTTEMPKACDIFFTSSTLPYLADPYGLLERGFASASKAVVLARNSFSEHLTFRVQTSRLFHNGAGVLPPGFTDGAVRYPHQTISEAKVRAMAEAHGFQLLARTPENDPYPPDDGVYGAQLTFVRSP